MEEEEANDFEVDLKKSRAFSSNEFITQLQTCHKGVRQSEIDKFIALDFN